MTDKKHDTETQPAKRTAEAKTDPVGAPVQPTPAETIDDLGIKANEPYPEGSPHDPEDDFEAAHGFRRAAK